VSSERLVQQFFDEDEAGRRDLGVAQRLAHERCEGPFSQIVGDRKLVEPERRAGGELIEPQRRA
ncbi:MAG TPA: hypothetical protein VJ717_01025, partial [Gemmatimonadaceae bacterium]|nr:hypothetical protein [Gemmatimonadaceae bacterium]